jgi:hypothetical protein
MMDKDKCTIAETLTIPHGIEIDINEAWRKLIQRQFGGSPGRGFSELIQNLLDSYPEDIDWQDRKGIIETSDRQISITDFGEGMNRTRLRLITTLGGTDKTNDKNKIGQFGIGFFSIFNPGLSTRKVTVLTMCEGHGVELVFRIDDPEKLPVIQSRLLNQPLPFSTKIQVEFNNSGSPQTCLDYASNSLTYYPCCVEINGSRFASVWETAKQEGIEIFSSGHCTGFIESQKYIYRGITLLRRYEKIMNLSIDMLMTGGHGMKFDLRDWAGSGTPYIPDVSVTINCNDLNVPISRDGLYLDFAYACMKDVINAELCKELHRKLESRHLPDLILANQYVLKNKIKEYMKTASTENPETGMNPVIPYLAGAKIYPVNGRTKRYSLMDIQNMRSEGLPVFFSPLRTNLRWLGGAFKRDFIVLPPPLNQIALKKTAPDFYDTLFETLFSDIVNLDTIQFDNEKMADLVKRQIIDKSSLRPSCRFVGARRLTEKENRCIENINRILEYEAVKKVISKHLRLNVSTVQAAFFEIQKSGGVIATGLFDEQGNPLEEDHYSNLASDRGSSDSHPASRPIFLGLQRDHEFINSLIETLDKYGIYYMLIYLSHELALCQKLLVPYSPYFHVVKERLARDMRLALIDHLLFDTDIIMPGDSFE